MNSGPSVTSSLFEILLAAFFVLLVFGLFLFAFATPILAMVSTTAERWPEYPLTKKIRILALASAAIAVLVILTIWAINPF